MESNEFNYVINVAGVQAAEGSGGGYLPKGYYSGTVKTVKMGTSGAGAPRLTFQSEVDEGEFKGVVRTWGQNLPTSMQDKNRTWFRTVMLSMGYSEAELEHDIPLTSQAFLGRRHYFFYEPKDPAMGVEYDNVRVLTRATWLKEKAAFESNPNRGITGTGATPPPGFGSQAPAQSFGAPAQSFGAPAQSFGGQAPAQGFGGQAPAQGFGGQAPAQGFGGQAPAQGFGGQAPTQGFGGQAPAAPGGGGMSPEQLMALLQGQQG